MKILLTAFEPFGGMDSNSSMMVLQDINKENVIKIILPVTYEGCVKKLYEAIDLYHPDFVMNLGMYGGSRSVHLEKIAINYTRAMIPDNAHDLRKEGKVFADGPDGIFTRVHIEELVDKIKEKVPCEVSLSAGGFICNSTYYASLTKMNGNALFIHLPYIEGMGEKCIPCFKKEDLVSAVEEALDYVNQKMGHSAPFCEDAK